MPVTDLCAGDSKMIKTVSSCLETTSQVGRISPALPGDTWQCVEIVVVVITLGGVLLASPV